MISATSTPMVVNFLALLMRNGCKNVSSPHAYTVTPRHLITRDMSTRGVPNLPVAVQAEAASHGKNRMDARLWSQGTRNGTPWSTALTKGLRPRARRDVLGSGERNLDLACDKKNPTTRTLCHRSGSPPGNLMKADGQPCHSKPTEDRGGGRAHDDRQALCALSHHARDAHKPCWRRLGSSCI